MEKYQKNSRLKENQNSNRQTPNSATSPQPASGAHGSIFWAPAGLYSLTPPPPALQPVLYVSSLGLDLFSAHRSPNSWHLIHPGNSMETWASASCTAYSRTPCRECNIATYSWPQQLCGTLVQTSIGPCVLSYVCLPNQYYVENNTKFVLPTWNVARPTWTMAVASKCQCDLIGEIFPGQPFSSKKPLVEALSLADPLPSKEYSQTGFQCYALKPSVSKILPLMHHSYCPKARCIVSPVLLSLWL